MKNSLPEPELIRQYLLGRLEEQDEHESTLSEQILFNDDLAELAELVEDEIIDEYLDGSLNAIDRNDVERYFLRPPERKEKLRFARVLRGYFETKQTGPVNPVVAHWSTRLRSYWSHAALILLAIVGLIYISRVRQREAFLETQVMRQKAGSADLTVPTSPVQAAVAVLTLELGRTRDIGAQTPHIEITRSTQRLIVEIVLPSSAPGPYDVQLESNDTQAVIWSARLLPLVSPDGARLLFDIPEEHIRSGTYFFTVSSGDALTALPRSSVFQVNVTK